jgi:hypothetical protein
LISSEGRKGRYNDKDGLVKRYGTSPAAPHVKIGLERTENKECLQDSTVSNVEL